MSMPDKNPQEDLASSDDCTASEPSAAVVGDTDSVTAQPVDSESDAVPRSSLDEQLAAASAERDENHERWLRAQAELENYRKRVQKESEEQRLYRALPVIRDLLGPLDNLRRAIAAAQTSRNVDDVLQGVEMVVRQLEEALKSHSAVPIEAVGQPFDPNLHEAVQQIPSNDQPAMTVMEEVECGYKLHERVVRPSKVIVSSGPPPEQA